MGRARGARILTRPIAASDHGYDGAHPVTVTHPHYLGADARRFGSNPGPAIVPRISFTAPSIFQS